MSGRVVRWRDRPRQSRRVRRGFVGMEAEARRRALVGVADPEVRLEAARDEAVGQRALVAPPTPR
jgi:hypothetical protein